MRRILTVCVTVVATVKRFYTAASRATRRFDEQTVRRKASFRFQQECLNAVAKCFIVGLHGRCTEIMCFPSLAKPLSGHYCRV
jgi:hypothetical protein